MNLNKHNLKIVLFKKLSAIWIEKNVNLSIHAKNHTFSQILNKNKTENAIFTPTLPAWQIRLNCWKKLLKERQRLMLRNPYANAKQC